MRTPLRRTSNKQRIGRLVFLIVIVLAIGLLVPPAARLIGATVMYPVQLVERWLTQSSMVVPVLWRDKIDMQAEISSLNQTVAELGRKDTTQIRLETENSRLRQLLSATTSERTLAVVTAKPTELPYDLLQVDRGSLAGIEVGSPVYIGSDSVIGLVSAVYPTHSFVTLFTTPGFLATVYLTGANVTATLEGMGGGVARVKVPQGILLRIGDLVHVPSVQPGVYGQITWVESEPTQPEQYGYITPAIPLMSLYQVAIGKPSHVTVDATSVIQYIETLRQEALVVPDLVLPETATSTDGAATSTPEVAIDTATTSPAL